MYIFVIQSYVTVLDGYSDNTLSLNMYIVKWKISGDTATFIGDMELGRITMYTEQY
jgi:hypothetical protein